MSSNESFINEEDPFLADAKTSTNSTVYPQASTAWIVFQIIYHLAVFVMCIFSLAVSSLLVYVLVKFERLKNDKNNIYFFHFALAVILDMTLPSVLSLLQALLYFTFHFESPGKYYCIISQINAGFTLIKMMSATSMVLVWYLQHNKKEFFQRNARWFVDRWVPTIYTIGGLHMLAAILDCALGWYFFDSVVFAIFYLTSIGIISFVWLATYQKTFSSEEISTKYMLLAGTGVIASWFPIFVISCFLFFHEIFQNINFYFGFIFINLYYLSEVLMYSDSVILFFLVNHSNKYFRMAFKSVFKKSVRKYRHDDLDGPDSDVENEIKATADNGNGNGVNCHIQGN